MERGQAAGNTPAAVAERGRAAANVWKTLGKLSGRQSIDRAFDDWLELMTACYCSFAENFARKGMALDFHALDGPFEAEYLKIAKRYERADLDVFGEAFGAVHVATGTGGRDVLGGLFMEHVSHGWNGQFFTPDDVCELMAEMTAPNPEDGARVLDPACGSGRMLHAVGRKNPRVVLCGWDIDRRCALMSVLNLVFLGFQGEVTWGNSLTLEAQRTWFVRPGGLVYTAVPD
jgi:type I restriction-modification system DNA methylase subunit